MAFQYIKIKLIQNTITLDLLSSIIQVLFDWLVD